MDLPYDSLVQRLHRVIRDFGDPRPITLVVDATGCGQPFVDLLRREKMGVLILPVAITSGGFGSTSATNGTITAPKKDLLSSANYLLSSGVLAAQPGLAGFKELKEEMEAYRVRTSRNGYDSFRSSFKDDLVMAFSLASWRARQYCPRTPNPTPPLVPAK